ncbi:hypothetical protein [Autumnicola musiva]|uniref:Uncharacterized protein n=1 Tax=Autumnicola musiva TaxID=3075589 RepID=A0ABU3DAB0_9FLAO|nr:hypothetical protein [Zunongwangia sp. F117]MDT0678444.1 hypothetical protein [Zunongwangia sp. F117]
MKKMRSIYLLLLISTATLFTSCSDDDDVTGTDDDMVEDASWLFATTHSGEIVQYNLSTGESISVSSSSNDAEGAYYDEEEDALTIVSRDPAQVQYYSGIEMWDEMSSSADADFSGTMDLQSPRDIAVNDDVYVISDNADVDGDDNTADGRFYIYTKTDSGFTLRNTVTVNFKVWGIEFIGGHLYAIVDTTNMLARFDNFTTSNTTDANVEASKMIAIEGIVRTHGLDYDDNTMVLTDIGDASDDSDGALHVIPNFDSKFNDTEDGGMLAISEQMRTSGSNTHLGNPVNVVYDEDSDMIYVAELANGGGRVLEFSNVSSESGNMSPSMDNMLSGVSALFLEDED